MEILKEIYAEFGEQTEPFFGLVFTVWQGKGGYFQNVKGVELFSPERIELTVHGGKATVLGSGLSVLKFVGGDLSVQGAVTGVTYEKAGNK